jgi:Terminase small subunit
MTRALRSLRPGAFALDNAKREAYARLRAENVPQLEAYRQAGYPTAVDARGTEVHNAGRLERRPDIAARIRYLANEATEFLGVKRVHVVNRLDRIGRANLADFFEPLLDDHGNRVKDRRGRPCFALKDITALPREITAALAGIEWDDDGQPKVKLHDQNQANIALLKYFGHIPDDDDRPQRTVNIFNVLSVDDQLALAAVLEALPAGAETIGGETAGEREPASDAP